MIPQTPPTPPALQIPQKPDVSREQLIADERAAEAHVVQVERDYRLAEALAPDTDEARADVAAKRDALAAARVESLAIRKKMVDGFDAWTRYASYLEIVRQDEADAQLRASAAAATNTTPGA